eukprot:GHVR01146544.1.p1 GENE.GHVR01146544.1~~GHVR01146544.1.p1  ORF type:complete len:209 (+),score=43.61 GHVR01146544.1:394-1020(+)
MMKQAETEFSAAPARWLGLYYLARAAFSFAWVAVALTLGQQLPMVGAALLALYPAWDAAANHADAARNGGLRQNRSQAINVVVSALTTALVLVTLPISPSAVLAVFGGWAIVSGLRHGIELPGPRHAHRAASGYTNTIEGVFSIFKRGMKGVSQHCSEKHLHRYLAEFDFRCNNRLALGIDDQNRAANALASVKGKRLTYQRANQATV